MSKTTQAYTTPTGSAISCIFRGDAINSIKFQSIMKIEFLAVRRSPLIPIRIEDTHKNDGAKRDNGYIDMITGQ